MLQKLWAERTTDPEQPALLLGFRPAFGHDGRDVPNFLAMLKLAAAQLWLRHNECVSVLKFLLASQFRTSAKSRDLEEIDGRRYT